MKSKAALPCLRMLYLTDQSLVSFSKIESLLKKRRALTLQMGDTDKWGCVRGFGGGMLSGRSFGRGYGRW